MHLFDIAVEGGQHFRESETLTAGDDVTVFDTEFGRMGLAVCYDMMSVEPCPVVLLISSEIASGWHVTMNKVFFL